MFSCGPQRCKGEEIANDVAGCHHGGLLHIARDEVLGELASLRSPGGGLQAAVNIMHISGLALQKDCKQAPDLSRNDERDLYTSLSHFFYGKPFAWGLLAYLAWHD